VIGRVVELHRGETRLLLDRGPSPVDRLVAVLHRLAAAAAGGSWLSRRVAGVLLRAKRAATALRSCSWR
jgi:hypothetical protein